MAELIKSKTKKLRHLIEPHVAAFGGNAHFAHRIGMTLSGFLRALKADRMAVEHLLHICYVTGLPPKAVFEAGGQAEMDALIVSVYGPRAADRKTLGEADQQWQREVQPIVDRLRQHYFEQLGVEPAPAPAPRDPQLKRRRAGPVRAVGGRSK